MKRSQRIYANLTSLASQDTLPMQARAAAPPKEHKMPALPPRTPSACKMAPLEGESEFDHLFRLLQDDFPAPQPAEPKQSTSLPLERSRPIAIPSPRSGQAAKSKKANKETYSEFEVEDLYQDERPNGKRLEDLMVECTQAIGSELYVFYYPVEIGDWSVNLWSKDQRTFSLSLYENGKPIPLTDLRLREWLPASSASTARAGNSIQFTAAQVEELLSKLRGATPNPRRSSL